MGLLVYNIIADFTTINEQLLKESWVGWGWDEVVGCSNECLAIVEVPSWFNLIPSMDK